MPETTLPAGLAEKLTALWERAAHGTQLSDLTAAAQLGLAANESLLRMLAHRARCFPTYPMGYHLPELFALLGEEPSRPEGLEATEALANDMAAYGRGTGPNLTREVVRAAMLLREWADKNDLRKHWHVAHIGDVRYPAEPALTPRCTKCQSQLTAEEVEFYGATCEKCEGEAHHAQQAAELADIGVEIKRDDTIGRRPEEARQADVTPLRQPRHDLGRLAADIKAVVMERRGAISVTEAIGALELVKLEIHQEQAHG